MVWRTACAHLPCILNKERGAQATPDTFPHLAQILFRAGPVDDHDTVIEQCKCRPSGLEGNTTLNTGQREGLSLPEHLRQILTQTHKRSE
jgi:hypothetical protein